MSIRIAFSPSHFLLTLACCAIGACGGGGSGDGGSVALPRIAAISVSPSEANLEALGATAQFEATARDQNGNTLSAQFSWDSSDSAVVSVNADGLVTAINNGTTTVTVSSGSVSASASVTVEQAPASIALSQEEVHLTALGAEQQLEASVLDSNQNAMSAELTWASSDPAVASVDEVGRLAARANGTATVTASIGSISESVAVTVAQTVSRVALVPESVTLTAIDQRAKIAAIALDANGHSVMADIDFASSDAMVASIGSDGFVTALRNGVATITAAAGPAAGTATVTVRQALARITVVPDVVTLTTIGQSTQLQIAARDANGYPIHVDVSLSSSDPAVATVSEAGVVTALADGTATVTATVRDQDRGLSVSVEITVGRRPLTVSGDPNVSDARGHTPLHAAAMANAPRLIAALLAAGADVDAIDRDGYTALHAAAARNAPAAIAALAEAGANVAARDRDGFTPLLRAAVRNASAAIAALLEAGADPNVRDGFGLTPLHRASLHRQHWTIENIRATVAALLEAGADPNARDYQGATPLHLAAGLGDSLAMTAALLEAGADTNVRASFANVAGGWTPLRAWVSVGQDPAILAALLEAGADIDTRDDVGNSLLHLAAERDKPATVRALLEAGAGLGARGHSGQTPLHAAAASRAVGTPLAAAAAMAVLLEAGADPNARDDAGHSALQLAPSSSAGLVTALLEAHAGGTVHDPNARDAFGYTALHAAARANNPELIAALVAAGADVDALDNDGYTPLLVAAGAKRRGGANAPPKTYSPEAITALAEAGADLDARNDWRWSALHFAAAAQSDVAAASTVLSALIEAGADLQARERNGFTALRMASRASHMAAIVALAEAEHNSFAAVLALAANDPDPGALVEAAVNPNARDDRGRTVLHHAIWWRDSHALAALAALVEAGADLNALDGGGDTPLHRAVQQTNAAMIAALVAAGADVEAPDTGGQTALQRAAFDGQPEMVAALVEAGAGPDAQDPRGQTALHLAANRDYRQPTATGFLSTLAVIAVLLEAGADPDVLDNFGNTPLHTAAAVNYRAATGILLALGAKWTIGSDSDPAEVNARIVAVELFQGPMVWQWTLVGSQAAGEASIADHAKTLLHRATTMAVRIGSESSEPMPELSVSLSDADGRAWAGQADPVQRPQIVFLPGTSESGLWETEYVYELPADWANSGHRATIAIDPYNRLDETDENDNTATLTMDGHAAPVFDVTFVPIVFSGEPPGIDTGTYMTVIGDLLPIGDYRAQVGPLLDLSGRNLGDSNPELSTQTALTELLHRWNAEAGENEYFHGLLSTDELGLGFGGLAFAPGKVAVTGAINERCLPEREFCGRGTHAHELGHNFGLHHAPGGCNETDPIDFAYPYAGAGIGPRRGWVGSRDVFVNPGTFSPNYDLMSYCIPRFVSDYNYNKMVDHRLGVTEQPETPVRLGPSLRIGPMSSVAPSMITLAAPYAAQSASAPAALSLAQAALPVEAEPAGVSGPSIAITGAIDEFGLWSIMRTDASTQPPRPPSTGGDYFFTLLDASWQEIYREPMDLLTPAHGATPRAWAVRVPVPEPPPAFVAVLDTHGTPLFIEPISAPATTRR